MGLQLNWFRKGLAALGLAALGPAPASAQALAEPRPALWKVADRDTTVYLFGTIHLLPLGARWVSPALERAADESQGLVLETIVDTANPAAFAATMMKLATSPGLPPVLDRVPKEKRAALATAIAKSRLAPASLDRMETWAVALALLGPQFGAMDLKHEEGVETKLKDRFTAAGKPIGQLETNEEQLRFFDLLPESAQQSLLLGTLESPATVSKQFDTMLSAWARGDVAAIGRSFNAEMDGNPALADLLLRQRNANWTRWIETRLGQPGTVMVAVGAGHLAGADSVQAMLGKRGLKVTRIQ
ncbi:TraB/GumN family protein [Sphingomonas glaciei]|uniref:TraB/GumN family protein n=1 Tax=Sphingomonas glaciei TaxID=2938948 RepID=A0ABY5MX08_9SPHN|nr:TraB/GumN family protein [Sphingomonas glaciei]UUR08014.1 TraB/GumN family protein [Sphingomonas glaciei]